jgi:hypothetical protein
MQREAVFVGVNSNSANTEFGGGAHHTNGDFAAVSD